MDWSDFLKRAENTKHENQSTASELTPTSRKLLVVRGLWHVSGR